MTWAYASLAATVVGGLTGYVGTFIVLWPFAAWASVKAMASEPSGRSRHASIVAASSLVLLAMGVVWIIVVVLDPLDWF